ncbi:hypothetical protein SNE40_004983 [Patella caerulea]
MSLKIKPTNEETSQDSNYTEPKRIWVIIAVLTPPDSSMVKFCQDTRWRVIIIGDDVYRFLWGKTRCIFHGRRDQRGLNFDSVKYIGTIENLPPRKNVAFLYAISQGADIICDMDKADVNVLQNIDLDRKWYMLLKNISVFNPLDHFAYTSSNYKSFTYEIVEDVALTIQTVMPYVNYEKSLENNVTFQFFDHEAPPIVVSSGTLLQFVPISRIYHKTSFWSAVSFSKSSSVDAMCHSQWQQRLIWEIGGTYIVHPSQHQGYPQNELKDKPLAPDCSQYLISWTCPQNLRLTNCMEELSKDVKTFTNISLDVLLSWIKDLHHLNYVVPSRSNIGSGASRYTIAESSRVQLTYSPKVLHSQTLMDKKRDFLESICEDSSIYTAKSDRYKRRVVDDVLLLVVFNLPFYKYVQWIHNMYSLKYSTMAYCGDSKELFLTATEHLNYSLTFIEEDVSAGFYIYQCVSAAIKIGYNVSGILMLSDDVLLNTWKTDELPKDRPWLHQVYTLHRDQSHNWYNWRQPWGQKAFKSVWQELTDLSKNSTAVKNSFGNFERRLQVISKSETGLCFGFEDIVYLPQRIFNEFVFFGDLFAKHKVFLEIALATLLVGLVENEELVMLPGSYLWDNDRTNYERFFNVSHIFMHPFKLGVESKKLAGLEFLCHTYIPYL